MSRSRKANNVEIVWQAIDYLVEHDFTLKWEFDAADPPPEEIRLLIAPYLSDGEIEHDGGVVTERLSDRASGKRLPAGTG